MIKASCSSSSSAETSLLSAALQSSCTTRLLYTHQPEHSCRRQLFHVRWRRPLLPNSPVSCPVPATRPLCSFMHPQICTRVVSTCYLLQGFIQVVPVESQCFDVAVNDLLFTEDVRVQSPPNHHIRLLEDTDFKYWMKHYTGHVAELCTN